VTVPAVAARGATDSTVASAKEMTMASHKCSVRRATRTPQAGLRPRNRKAILLCLIGPPCAWFGTGARSPGTIQAASPLCRLYMGAFGSLRRARTVTKGLKRCSATRIFLHSGPRPLCRLSRRPHAPSTFRSTNPRNGRLYCTAPSTTARCVRAGLA
jgi:hypothetical protein